MTLAPDSDRHPRRPLRPRAAGDGHQLAGRGRLPIRELLVLNEPLAAELGLDPSWLRSRDGVRLLVGNSLPAGANPVAQAYAGHQFGGYSPRARRRPRAAARRATLDADGRLRDLHLKGSGRTPFARGGDGLAAVGPMLREYVVSEAMHALGHPHHPLPGRGGDRHAGAARDRAARRRARPGGEQPPARRQLPVRREPPATSTCCAGSPTTPSPGTTRRPRTPRTRYLALFEAVVAAQASLVAQWMLVGFIHGVMNTDNMTISGETIDYGPCAFMEAYDPATVYSSIDTRRPLRLRQPAGRRRVEPRPPRRGAAAAARTTTRTQAVALAVESLGGVPPRVRRRLVGRHARQARPACRVWTTRWLAAGRRAARAAAARATSTTRRSSAASARPRAGDAEPARGLFLDLAAVRRLARALARLGPDAEAMDRVNPVYIPRNHLVEEALAAATDGDLEPLERPPRRREPLRTTSGPASSATPSPRPEDFAATTAPSAAPEPERSRTLSPRRSRSPSGRPLGAVPCRRRGGTRPDGCSGPPDRTSAGRSAPW